MSREPKKQEITFQLLFSLDMGGGHPEEILPFFMKEMCISKTTFKEASLAAQLIWEARAQLDQIIMDVSKDWAFSRISPVEKNVIRWALYELEIKEIKLPPKIVIAEALRLTSKFSSSDGSAFVNAILDKYCPDQEESADESPIPPSNREIAC